MEAMTTKKTATLEVPGAKLYYEVRGSGPLLLMMPGGPSDAGTFRKIEDALGERYTVVTYDPRTYSHSELLEPVDDDRMVEIFADDAHRLIQACGGGKAKVFASSGGASIAFELVKRHAGELDCVVFHEPPSPDLLDDPEATRAEMVAICETCERDGLFPAMQRFMNLIGIHDGPPAPDHEPTPEELEGMAMMQKNFEYFFGRYIANLGRYRVDFAALKGADCRLVAGIGTDSAGQLAYKGGVGLAAKLGIEPTVFPGDHGGFDGRPAEFGPRLLEVLEG
jgi:pimeloyl-ACP methyl ester carboxylesterase